jgi:hypothetical protein
MASLSISVDGDSMNIGGTLDLWPGWGFYKPRLAVKARRMEYPFKIDTAEGAMVGKVGDYLLVGVLGNLWVEPGAKFENEYELVAEVDPPPDPEEESGVAGASVLDAEV